MLRSSTGGLYKSINRGETWTIVGDADADFLAQLRKAGRIDLAVSGADTATPTLYLGTVVADKMDGLYRVDIDSTAGTASVRFVMSSPTSIEKNGYTVATVKASSADPAQWRLLAANTSFVVLSRGNGFFITPDFTVVGSMDEVAKRIESAINSTSNFGPGFVTVTWIAATSPAAGQPAR